LIFKEDLVVAYVMAAEAEIKIGQVDDVQELHRAGLETVPERYIRDGDDRPGGDNVCALAHIPVIDVGVLTRDDELNKLKLACEEWGFFQVIDSLLLLGEDSVAS